MRRFTRRHFLQRTAAGFGSLALTDLLSRGNPSAPGLSARLDAPHFSPSAKRVIFLFMHGGPSQVDTFDYKPLLQRDHGKPLPFEKARVVDNQTGNLFRSPWNFRQYGESGIWVSDLFPEVAKQVDKLTVIKSLHGSNPAHGPASLMMHTGSDTFVRPSMGSWISYGLGTENENLPGFITICPTYNHGGTRNFGAAFLPAVHQATPIGREGLSMKQAKIENLVNHQLGQRDQRSQLDLLEKLNRMDLEDGGASSALEARISSFEMAFRMQTESPDLLDISRETPATRKLYGIDEKHTDDFGRQCLLARRLSESGVRFIQCSHHGSGKDWDQHSNLEKGHSLNAKEVDKPISALLQDLESRGLLKETVVIWGGEFGRTPGSERKNGRDHHPHGFTWWMAGGGLKPGISYGETDDYGYYAVKDKVHVHDLHATLLHLLGVDHERLTFPHAGRDFRLTDVHGQVVRDILI